MLENLPAENVTSWPSKDGEPLTPTWTEYTKEFPTKTLERKSDYNDDFTKEKIRKGFEGEQTVIRWLDSIKNISYVYHAHSRHEIDFTVLMPGEGEFLLDVKTFQKRYHFDDYGFNLYSYKYYKKLQKNRQLPVMVIFVDYTRGAAFGNYLDVIDQPYQQITYRGTHLVYPLIFPRVMKDGKIRDIINFPSHLLIKKYDLLPDEIEAIRNARPSRY